MINWRARSYSEEEFRSAWVASSSYTEVLESLKLNKSGGSVRILKETAEELGLNRDHFFVKARSNKKLTSEEIFVEGSRYPTTHLKKRLIEFGHRIEMCYGCQRTSWENFLTGVEEPINLTVDHINGVNNDHRLENLRILCNNCHSVTPTYCGKNRRVDTGVKVVV